MTLLSATAGTMVPLPDGMVLNTAGIARPDRLWCQWDRGPTDGRYAIYVHRDLSPDGYYCCQRRAGTMVPLLNGTVFNTVGSLNLIVFGASGTAVPLTVGMPFFPSGTSALTDITAASDGLGPWSHFGTARCLILLGSLNLIVFVASGTAVPLTAGMQFISTGAAVLTDVPVASDGLGPWSHFRTVRCLILQGSLNLIVFGASGTAVPLTVGMPFFPSGPQS